LRFLLSSAPSLSRFVALLNRPHSLLATSLANIPLALDLHHLLPLRAITLLWTFPLALLVLGLLAQPSLVVWNLGRRLRGPLISVLRTWWILVGGWWALQSQVVRGCIEPGGLVSGQKPCWLDEQRPHLVLNKLIYAPDSTWSYAEERGPLPSCYSSSGSYWKAVGSFKDNPDSLSHSWPSETEARVYCEAAGFAFPEVLP